MQILQIVLIIAPGIIAAHIYEFIKKSDMKLKDWLYHAAKFVVLIFWIVNLIEYMIGWGEFDWTRFSVQFLFKYIPLTMMLAVTLPPINLFFDSKFFRS